MKSIKPQTNTIFRGDNLAVMRGLPKECVDLIYIDPPFFTQRDYQNIWGDKESVQDYRNIQKHGFTDKADYFEKHLKSGSKGLDAYLEWMRFRVIEVHRILKNTGTFYLHLDHHAVHYMKVVCDDIFGYKNFRSEIIWKRKQGTSSAVHTSSKFGVTTDTILVYSKTDECTFNPQYSEGDSEYKEYLKKNFRYDDGDGKGLYRIADLTNPAYRPNLIYNYKGYAPTKNGWAISKEKMALWDKEGRIYFPESKSGRLRRKVFLSEMKGCPIQNLWHDIPPVSPKSAEHQGWPTQKPVALLERIIAASSNEGDIVFDAFAGCGTSMHAAHNLKRKWIGIDISPTAIKVNKKRLEDLGAKVNVVDEKELKETYGIDARLKAA